MGFMYNIILNESGMDHVMKSETKYLGSLYYYLVETMIRTYTRYRIYKIILKYDILYSEISYKKF